MRLVAMAGIILVGGLFSVTAWSTPIEPDPALNDAKKEKVRFTVTSTEVQANVGASTSASVQVAPAKGYKWNLEYPAKLTIAGDPAHVKLTKSTFKQLKGDFKATEKKASVKIAMEATSAGTETLLGTIKFSVCDEATCVIEKADVKITVTIAP